MSGVGAVFASPSTSQLGRAVCSISSRDEEILEIMREVLSGKGSIIIEATDSNFEELTRLLSLLIQTSVGRSLVRGIMAHQGESIIITRSYSSSHYIKESKKVFLHLGRGNFRFLKSGGRHYFERGGSEMDKVATLGHELFHALLDLQGRSVLEKAPTSNPDFDNLEEEIVIETGEFAENKTRRELGIGERIDHRGYTHLIEVLVCAARLSVKASGKISLSEFLPGVSWNKKGLSIALAHLAENGELAAVNLGLAEFHGQWTPQDLEGVLTFAIECGKLAVVDRVLGEVQGQWTPEDCRRALEVVVEKGKWGLVDRVLSEVQGQLTPENLSELVRGGCRKGERAFVKRLLAECHGQWSSFDLEDAAATAVFFEHEEIVDLLRAETWGEWDPYSLKWDLIRKVSKGDEKDVKDLLASACSKWTPADLKEALLKVCWLGRGVLCKRFLVAGGCKREEICKALLAASSKWTPADLKEALKVVASFGDGEMVKQILTAAEGQWSGEDLREPLKYAVVFGDKEMVNQLLAAASDSWRVGDIQDLLRYPALPSGCGIAAQLREVVSSGGARTVGGLA